ncbi:cytochrome P450 [Crucibulum laeve]|uniref:Cytochrome P450 n=1 Tax=Crucibulum laeve TaxID=68775 RepID=A0A5C3LPR7_9AGAR|nr:cytochrome P450 [Crucibulum laeve]
MSTYVILYIICVSVTLWRYRRLLSRRYLPLPPGPPADPIIGHSAQFLKRNKAITFISSRMFTVHGSRPVIHLKVPGRTIIILNTVEAAINLLDKRSANYSDRSKLPLYDIMGWNANLGFLPYGKRFQKHRRLFQEYFSRAKCNSYQSVQLKQARLLVKQLAKNPECCSDALQWFATSIVMHIVYGRDVISDDDIFVKIVKDAAEGFHSCGSAGNTTVDLLPFLQYMPSWFPGTYYVKKAHSYKAATKKVHDLPYEIIKSQLGDGVASPSYLSYHIERLYQNDGLEVIDDIKGSAATIYTAGGETTWSTLLIFALAMVLHPDCQREAQEEMDRVVGSGRLPEFSDRPSLPYVECLVQEVHRWNSSVPIGIPHRSMEDDTYNGMFIPKGSIVIANTRGISLDESVYLEPYQFYPSRFLPKPQGSGEPYITAHFGFGRQVCPGRYLADDKVWIAIASTLAMLSISKAVGKDGKEITPDFKFNAHMINASSGSRHPSPFVCNIKPRNEATASTLMEPEL